MLARTLAYLRREGRSPKGLRIDMKLSWDDEPPPTDEQLADTEWSPWYAVDDKGDTFIPLDGSHRLSTFLTNRRRDA